MLDPISVIKDPCGDRRVAHPLREILLLFVCATMAECDDCEAIAAWRRTHPGVLRRYLPYENGGPGGRSPTIGTNQINPELFSAAFAAWVRAAWPERPDLVAIDGIVNNAILGEVFIPD